MELRTGVNWVAWLGRDNWIITDVAKGIGKFLSEIRLGDHVYDPANPETANDWPTVSRGDALVVTVSRGVNWLQPTYVMPEVIFAGNVGQGIRKAVKRDLADMAAYNAEAFGVQADPFRLVIIIPGDVRSLFDELERLGRPWELESLRSWWQRSGGLGGADININKAEFWNWSRGRYSYGRYVLLEEYFHAIQYQLVGDAADWPPTWMVEGSINWIRGDLATQDRTGYPLSRRIINARNQASKGPPLEDIEEGNETWQYSFGLLAADLLIERAGTSALLDFFRAFAPGRTGSNGRWESQLTWQGAFAATYGITVQEFYAEFESMMAKLRGSARRRPVGNQVTLQGTVVDGNGAPRPGVRLTSREVKNGAFTTFGAVQANSDENGEFALFVRKRADHRIRVRLSDHSQCRYWWTSEADNRARSAEDADLIEVGTSDPPPLTITVDGDKCRWRISGTLSGPDDEPLAGIEVRAQGAGRSISARTEIDGSFSLVTFSPGAHHLYTNLGGCRLYWSEENSTEDQGQAGDIQVVDRDVADVQFMVPPDFCDRVTLGGRLLESNGNGIDGVQIYAKADGDRVSGRTYADGRFQILLAEPGEYQLYAYVDGCRVYYRPESATGVSSERALISVSDQDVNDLVFQLQEDMCTLRLSGTLSNADGTPKSGVYVRAQDGSLLGGDWPSEEGAFSFTVPAAGSYKLNVTIDGCRVYYAGDGASGAEDQARALSLSDSTITGIRFVLPDNPCLTISGRLLDSSGDGIEGVQVNAQADTDRSHGRTDAGGRFQITLSDPGNYRLYAWIDGCRVYYRPESATGVWNDHALITVSDQDVNDIVFQLQEDMCTLRIAGNLFDADGSAMSDVWVRADTVGQRGGITTSADGVFSFKVPGSGSYTLSVAVDGCRVFYAGHGVSGDEDVARALSLIDSDITRIRFVLPENPCLTIDGHLLDSKGDGIEGVQVNAWANGDVVEGGTDSDGRFRITLSEPGDYQVYAWTNGCLIYYRQDRTTAHWSERTLITVADDDISGIRLQLEPDMCMLRISGQLLNADGSPESAHFVRGGSAAGEGGAWPSDDGTFSFAVPAAGSYKLWVTLDDCQVYYVTGGAAGPETESSALALSGADVNGIEFRLPEDPSTFCN